MKQRGFGQILVLIIIVALIGCAYYFGKSSQKAPATSQVTPVPSPTPTPDETANWETYTSAKYGYSFKYPATINDVAETEDSKGCVIVIISTEKGSSIDIATQGECADSPGYKYKYDGDPISTKTFFTTIGSDKLTGTEDTFSNGRSMLRDPLTTHGLVFLMDHSKEDTSFEKTASQILSTFKFKE